MKKNTIQIALADDHTMFRTGIASLLSEYDDIRIVFEAANGKELMELLPTHPDTEVILMDINMPVMDGYATTEWVSIHYPNIQVLALSMFDDEMAVIKMLKAGAGGYVLKESKPAELYRAINEIKEKGVFLNEVVSGQLIRRIQTGRDKTAFLTEKEICFIRLCVSEMTYKEIAAAMKIAPRSADNYRESLFEKLNVKSRVGLVLFAIKNKLVDIRSL
jgi:DNA-binding NarL/FixJ family response regulator